MTSSEQLYKAWPAGFLQTQLSQTLWSTHWSCSLSPSSAPTSTFSSLLSLPLPLLFRIFFFTYAPLFLYYRKKKRKEEEEGRKKENFTQMQPPTFFSLYIALPTIPQPSIIWNYFKTLPRSLWAPGGSSEGHSRVNVLSQYITFTLISREVFYINTCHGNTSDKLIWTPSIPQTKQWTVMVIRPVKRINLLNK